jgi:hypothetical protein
MLRKSLAVAAFVLTALSSTVHAQICAPFTDVLASSGFCTNIQWLFNRGVTLGCTATQYCPANFVRRDQMAAFLNRLADRLFPLSCATGQVLKWNGTAWMCASDAAGPVNAFMHGGNAFGTGAILGTTDDQRLTLRVNGVHAMHFEPRPAPQAVNIVGGSSSNSVFVGVFGATVAGGGAPGSTSPAGDECDNPYGCANVVTDHYGTIGGGIGNLAGDNDSNPATARGATVAGGRSNHAGGALAFVGGGRNNQATGPASVVAGGDFNVASSANSTVAGGTSNEASGPFSFAAGTGARAVAAGEFVWADFQEFFFDPATSPGVWADATNTFNARATGGVWFVTGINPVTGVPTWSCYATNGTGWTCTSDREAKRNLEPLDGVDVLAKVAALPIYRWQPKDGSHAHVVHAGPTAQDFHAAFRLGNDEKAIGMQDADGVALAAIQGLNVKLEAQARELAAQREEIAELRQALRELGSANR